MRRGAFASFFLATSATALTAAPAGAGGHAPPPPPAASDTYQVMAPTPMPVHSAAGGCTVGAEGVHKHSRLFKVGREGTLTFSVTNFTGDWDAGIVDKATGRILDYAPHLLSSVQTVQASLAANQAVDMVACNFAGGPTATASFGFAPAHDQLVSVGDVKMAEGDRGGRAAVFTVTLSKPPTTTMAVNYATADDTATAGLDYKAKSGTLYFAAGVVTGTVKVPILADTAEEGDETFRLSLHNARPLGVVVGDGAGVGTIVDDDPGTGRRLAVGDVAAPEGDAATRPAVFTVTLSKPSTSAVTVNYATADMTATADDYTGTSGTLTFPAGTTATTVKIPVTGDTAVENDESFTVTLSDAVGATISRDTGVGTITDDM